MKFINVLFFLLIMLSVYAAFKPQATEFSYEVYYYMMEKKNEPTYQDQEYEKVFSDEKYFDGKTFRIDAYANDLGYVKDVSNNDCWHRGRRFFTLDTEKSIIGIKGDEWSELSTYNEFAKKNSFSIVREDGSFLVEKVNEETMIYIVSEMLHLSQNNNLHDVTDDVRADIEDYHTNGVSK